MSRLIVRRRRKRGRREGERRGGEGREKGWLVRGKKG